MIKHFKLRLAPFVLLIAALIGSGMLAPIPAARAINTPWLHVTGNKIMDPSNNVVILRGVSLVDVSVADSRTRNARQQIDMATDSANGWYARVIRLPVYADAIDGQPGWNSNPDAYFNNHLNPAVQECVVRQIYCIVDWHYISDYNNSTIDTSTRNFWTYMAPKYANTPNVIYELFNEPINPNDWNTWKTWAQPWVNIIRAAAPNNLILIGGPSWSQNVSQAATSPFSGSNLVYVAHIYPQHGGQSVWDSWFGNSSATAPYFITEWGWQQGGATPTNGTTSGFGTPFSNYLETKAVSWTAWVHDVSWQPVMFDANWNLLGGENFMGQFIKDELAQHQNDNLPGNGPTNTPTRTNTPIGPTNTPTRTNTPTPGGTIRVESGGTANFTDTAGHVWAADNSFTGGSTADRGAIAIANTNDDRIYQTERYGAPFSYAFNVANGTYTVNLHFAETFFTSSGQRVFSVTAEGATIVSNLDIFAAGGANTALIRTANVTVNDGQLNLNFTASVNNALVNGIEIIPGSSPTATPTNTPAPTNLLTNGNMESGTTGWTCNGCTGTSDTSQFHGGTHSLNITARTAAWAGPNQDVTSKMTNGHSYSTEVWVKLASGTASARIKIKVVASTTTYITMTPDIAVNATGWTKVSGTGTVSWSGTLTQAVWYVETATGTTSFYVDDALLN